MTVLLKLRTCLLSGSGLSHSAFDVSFWKTCRGAFLKPLTANTLIFLGANEFYWTLYSVLAAFHLEKGNWKEKKYLLPWICPPEGSFCYSDKVKLLSVHLDFPDSGVYCGVYSVSGNRRKSSGVALPNYLAIKYGSTGGGRCCTSPSRITSYGKNNCPSSFDHH